jgi:HlyD family secretion protein
MTAPGWVPAAPEILPFMDPIDQICEAAPPRLLRSILTLVAALFASLLVTASVVKVDVVVVAIGHLTTDTPPIVIQPMQRSIIRTLRVKPGDHVVKGEILAELDPTFAEADVQTLIERRRSITAQLQRMVAEQDGVAFRLSQPPSADELLQSILYRQRRAQYASRLREFDEEIQRLQADAQSMEVDRLAAGKQVDVARAVETMRATLMGLKAGSRLQLLEASSSRLRAEREQLDAANRLPGLQHAMESKQAERQSFIDAWQREISENLVTLRGEAAATDTELAKASRLNQLVVVTASSDGVVLDTARLSAGSVLREAEPLVTVIPADATLIADVLISSADVGFAQPGSDVEVKVDAYPYQQHGVARGRLLSVSEGSSSGQPAPNGTVASDSGAFHHGRVMLLGARLDGMPEGARLFPGMTVHTDIKAGSRSVLGYFLYPLSRGLRESLREP